MRVQHDIFAPIEGIDRLLPMYWSCLDAHVYAEGRTADLAKSCLLGPLASGAPGCKYNGLCGRLLRLLH